VGSYGLDLSGSYEHSKEPLGSIKGRKSLLAEWL